MLHSQYAGQEKEEREHEGDLDSNPITCSISYILLTAKSI